MRPIEAAASACSIEMIEVLLEHGARLLHTNALHWAVASRRAVTTTIETMSFLLDLGMDVNGTLYEDTPCFHGHASETVLYHGKKLYCHDTMRLLLLHGADPRKPNENDELVSRDLIGWALKTDYDDAAEL